MFAGTGSVTSGGARRMWWMAVAVAWSLVATACGSTVPGEVVREQDGSVAVGELGGEPPGEGIEAEAPAGAEAGPDEPGVAHTPGAPDRRPGQGLQDGPEGTERRTAANPEATQPQAAERPEGTERTAAGGPTPAGRDARGVTDDTIRIGMYHLDRAQVGAVEQGLGQGGRDQGTQDDRDAGEAIAAYINEHGGVAGRRLDIVWHDADVPSLVTAEGRRRDAQRACATWTEDNEVFALMATTFVDDIYLDCARRNNAVIMYGDGFAVDEQLFGSMRHLWYGLTRMIVDRRDENLVENLVRRGVLTPEARVGIVVQDWEAARRGVSNGMEPALAAHGIEVVEKAVYPDALSSPWDTYVLRFRSAGVTHVLFAQAWDGADGFPLLFTMRAAENQAWRPIWGIGSDNKPAGVAAGGAPRAQLANAFGMGWQPRWDLGRYEDTAARERCAGIAGRPLERSGDPNWHIFCEELFFFRAALNAAPEISPAGMSAALDVVGDRFESIELVGGRTSFGSDRHYGVALQRDLAYNEDCADDGTNCWRYVGGPHPMP